MKRRIRAFYSSGQVHWGLGPPETTLGNDSESDNESLDVEIITYSLQNVE
jgi:hypothetical protein